MCELAMAQNRNDVCQVFYLDESKFNKKWKHKKNHKRL